MPAPNPPSDPLKGIIWADLQPTDGTRQSGYDLKAELFCEGWPGPFTIADPDGTQIAIPKEQFAKSGHTGRCILPLYGNDIILPAASYWLVTQAESDASYVVELAAQDVVNLADVVPAGFPTGGSFTPPRLFFTTSIVRAATTANITISTALNNGDTLDGLTLATGDRVLVKDQSSAAQNGVYSVGVVPVRTSDFNEWDEFPGAAISVTAGTANIGTIWRCMAAAGGTLDTTSITFQSFGGVAAGGTTWGSITGTLADQTDLQSALDAKQTSDATLTAFAALTIAANSLTIGNGADAFSQTTFAANTFPARASTGNLVAKTITDFALTILDDADGAAVRTTIGAGTGSGDALVANPLSQFAATTSLQLKDVISDETGSGSLVFATAPTIHGIVFGTGSGGDKLLSLSAAALNVFAVQNTHADGYGAVAFVNIDGIEHGAVGVGNTGGAVMTRLRTYLEASDLRTSAGDPDDGFVLFQTNARVGGYSVPRMDFGDTRGDITFSCWSGASESKYTFSYDYLNLAGTDSYGVASSAQLNREIRADANAAVVYRSTAVGTGQDRNIHYSYGDTLANFGGHLFYTGGVRASQTLRLQISDNGSAFSGPLTAASYNGNTITTGTGTLTLGSSTLNVTTGVTVPQGGTGRLTGTTAYALIATGTTATGAQQTLANGATTEILVGGGASALPVWTTATGTGAPVRATSPALETPNIGIATASSVNGITLIGPGQITFSGDESLTVNASGSVVVQESFGTGVYAGLTTNIGSAGAPVLYNGALGTPSSGTLALSTLTLTGNLPDARNTVSNSTTTTMSALATIGGLTTVTGTGAMTFTGGAGGMTLSGGTAANDDILIQGTTNATRTTSYVRLQPNGGNVGIGGFSTPLAPLDVGTTYRFLVFSDYAGNGDLPANSVIASSSNGNFNLLAGSISPGTNAVTIGYYNGSLFKTALTVANVASGTATLSILPGGGAVTNGGTLSVTGASTLTGGIIGCNILTGGAGNMTITAGTGNSRTMALQTTSGAGVAQTNVTLNADQSSTFTGNVNATSFGGLPISGLSGTVLIDDNASGANHLRIFALDTVRIQGNSTVSLNVAATQYIALNSGTVQLKLPTEVTGTISVTGASTLTGAVTVGSGVQNAKVGGAIFDDYVDGASVSVDGTEDTLATHTLAASTFGANGQKVCGFYQIAIIGHAISTDRIRLYAAGTAIFDTAALNFPVSSALTIVFEIIRVSSTVLRAAVFATTTSATLIPYTQYTEITGLTLTNTQIVALKSISTGTNSAVADVTMKMGKIQWLPAA